MVSVDKLKRDWIREQTSLIGSLAEENPELADDWARLLAHSDRISPESAENGRLIAERFGLTERIEASLLPSLRAYSNRTFLWLSTGAALLLLILGLAQLNAYRKQFGSVRKLAVALENAVKHNEPMSFRIYGEGEIGLLANGVQEVANRLRQTIEQLNRDKDFLRDTVADISHQLKTPLSSLILYNEWLREGNVDKQTAEEFLTISKRELERMEWLTLALLKIARLEANALEMHMRLSRLAATVDRSVEALSTQAGELGVRIVIDSSSPFDLVVNHDPKWLSEALQNVIKNALEHSPRGGTVRVRWEETPVFARLFVEDEGRGIDEKHAPHIFKKFYRSSSGGSGVGLGLPLSKSIVERHGGMLSAVPNPEGKGSRFAMTLPLRSFGGTPAASDSYDSVMKEPEEL